METDCKCNKWTSYLWTDLEKEEVPIKQEDGIRWCLFNVTRYFMGVK